MAFAVGLPAGGIWQSGSRAVSVKWGMVRGRLRYNKGVSRSTSSGNSALHVFSAVALTRSLANMRSTLLLAAA
jgi:hypothetical protein